MKDDWLTRAAFALAACSIGLSLGGCSASASEPPLASVAHAGALAASADGVLVDRPVAATGVETAGARLRPFARGRCPSSMVAIDGDDKTPGYCIDRFEATLMDLLPDGTEVAHSPFESIARGGRVRAVSEPNVFPQGYVSAVEAKRACTEAGKRLCRVPEWQKACRGPEGNRYGYGERREPGRCNDRGRNPVIALHGLGHWNWQTMNQPILNQLDGTLARTGTSEGCTNGYGVFDMVGNLHEWVADPRGAFFGGYYQDVASVGHGEGCGYRTTAHEARYHDYSTGFRCCAELAGSSGASEEMKPAPKAKPKKATPKRKRRPRR